MKPILKIIFLFCIIVFSGSMLGQFCPLIFWREGSDYRDNIKNVQVPEKNVMGFKYISEQLSTVDLLNTILNMSKDALNEELAVLLSKKKWDTDFLNASSAMLLEKLVRDYPEQAMSLLRSRKFIEASEEIKVKVTVLIFCNLTHYYPQCFFDALMLLKTDWNAPLFEDYGYFSCYSFSNELEIEGDDLEWLYQYVTEGHMDRLREFICGNLKEGHVIAEWFHGFSESYLWQNFLKRHGMEKRDLLLSELNRLKDNKGFYERNRLIEGFIFRITEENASEALTWAMEHLYPIYPLGFINSYFDSLNNRDAKASEYISFIDRIDIDIVSVSTVKDAAVSIAQKDMLGAIDLINVSLKGSKRESALSDVLSVLNKKASVQEMLQIINGLSDGICKDNIARPFLEKYYAESPEAAVTWVRENFTYEKQETLLRKVQGDAYEARIVMGAEGNPKAISRIARCGVQ